MMSADIRTAAQREAKRLRVTSNGREYGMAKLYKVAFVDGAVWAQARVTPTREQIAEVVRLADGEWNLREGTDREDPRTHGTAIADAILALMQGLTKVESSG